jgi:hypothetical protein
MQGEIIFDSFFLIVVLIVVVSAIYFLPAIVAASREHHRSLAIFILNFFLGWTGLVWLGALIWASTRVIDKDDPHN